MRDYVRRLLSDRYEVEAVADGVAALSAAQRQIPDLVLSDVMMPGLDGFALLKALRAHPDTREVPVILLSARAGEESRIEGLEAGADDYLITPFPPEDYVLQADDGAGEAIAPSSAGKGTPKYDYLQCSTPLVGHLLVIIT